MSRHLLAVPLVVALLVGCATTDGSVTGEPAVATSAPATSGTDQATTTEPVAIDCAGTADARFPDVVDAELTPRDDGTFTVAATLCSAYDTPERYADAWRVSAGDGEVLAVRELAHDHAGEQPFTRSLASPLEVPAGVTELVFEGHDQANGWGGATLTVSVPGS